MQKALFRSFLRGVEVAFAEPADLQLVASARCTVRSPSLSQLLTLLPRWTKLCLVACTRNEKGPCFGVYRVVGPADLLLSLNPHLTPLLPWCGIDGQPRLLAPEKGTTSDASVWLVQARAGRLWGADHALISPSELAW